ncbi:hypothetical protein A2U01_0087435, partial [Trifolium medium]|nr:hypothetical protein [Trifolium medium]
EWRVIMLMNVGVQDLLVSTVRNRVTLPEIVVLQRRDRQRMLYRELDPLPKDVSTVWALKWAVRPVMLYMRIARLQVTL